MAFHVLLAVLFLGLNAGRSWCAEPVVSSGLDPLPMEPQEESYLQKTPTQPQSPAQPQTSEIKTTPPSQPTSHQELPTIPANQTITVPTDQPQPPQQTMTPTTSTSNTTPELPQLNTGSSTPKADNTPLPSPTSDYELYRQKLDQRYELQRRPDDSVQLDFVLRPFKRTDLRARTTPTFHGKRNLYGGYLSYEHYLRNHHGLWSLGIIAGGFGTESFDGFTRTIPALILAGPLSTIQFHFVDGQWIVPYVQGAYQLAYYHYDFSDQVVCGFKWIARLDLGLAIYLNFFESSSAANMSSNYGIKRTYLVGSYTNAWDQDSLQDFNLSEDSWRVGLRFEF